MKVKMVTVYFSTFRNSISASLWELQSKIENWNDKYDERECNEPEYDSQIEKWQESLDNLQEKIENLTEITEALDAFVDELDEIHVNEGSYNFNEFDIDVDEFKRIVSDLNDFCDTYRGIKSIVKKIEKAGKLVLMSI